MHKSSTFKRRMRSFKGKVVDKLVGRELKCQKASMTQDAKKYKPKDMSLKERFSFSLVEME